MRVIRQLVFGSCTFFLISILALYFVAQHAGRSESVIDVSAKVFGLFLIAFVFPFIVLLHGTWSLLTGSNAYWWWADYPMGAWGVVGSAGLGLAATVVSLYLALQKLNKWWSFATFAIALAIWFVTAVFCLGAVSGGA